MPERIRLVEEDVERQRSRAEWIPEDEEDGKRPIGLVSRLLKPAEPDSKSKAANVPLPPRHEEAQETLRQAAGNLSDLFAVSRSRRPART